MAWTQFTKILLWLAPIYNVHSPQYLEYLEFTVHEFQTKQAKMDCLAGHSCTSSNYRSEAA